MIGSRANLLVKVCGLNDAQNVKAISLLKPDFLGCIFYAESPRSCILPVADVDGSVTIGVFVDASLDFITAHVNKYTLLGVQLHGNESPDFCKCLKDLLPGILILKAISVSNERDFEGLSAFGGLVDYLLFDTKSALHGGSGLKFNWTLLNKYSLDIPFFLSGGIGLEDIDSIKNIDHPQLVGVDINSKFETEPGLKNIKAVSEFIHQIRAHYGVNYDGYFGEFGGAYIPEMLVHNVEELKANYLKIMADPNFEAEFRKLLKDYVGRPSPLYKASRLSEKYNAKIYLKREDLNHTGAHKINNTIGQILLAERLGKRRIVAETGAGQHGVATATVCALKGLECVVFMGAIDIERQAANVVRMKMLGATVIPATSGSQTLKDATNEAMRYWINNAEDTYYIIGSVVGPHPYPDMVAKFQSIISEETRAQLLEQEGTQTPNYVLACVGGGSNAMGMFYHFLEEEDVQLIAIEAGGKGVDSGFSAATTQLGKEGVLHGSKSILMQTADGQVVEPHSISAGLDYPGIGPQHAHLFKSKRAKYVSITDTESLDAGLLLTKMEGIIPAIESAHALAYLEKMDLNSTDIVVLCLSGRGDKDLETYTKHFNFK